MLEGLLMAVAGVLVVCGEGRGGVSDFVAHGDGCKSRHTEFLLVILEFWRREAGFIVSVPRHVMVLDLRYGGWVAGFEAEDVESGDVLGGRERDNSAIGERGDGSVLSERVLDSDVLLFLQLTAEVSLAG